MSNGISLDIGPGDAGDPQADHGDQCQCDNCRAPLFRAWFEKNILREAPEMEIGAGNDYDAEPAKKINFREFL